MMRLLYRCLALGVVLASVAAARDDSPPPATQPAASQPTTRPTTRPAPAISRVESINPQFDPSQDRQGAVRFHLSTDANVTLTIYGPNEEKIVDVVADLPCKRGPNSIDWNGRDTDGHIVPNEAYFFTLRAVAGDQSDMYDPLSDSGGERIIALDLRGAQEGSRLTYQLPKACRVLARAVVVEGPLLRTMVNWEPRPRGLCMEQWDGLDSSGIRKLAGVDNVLYVISAFALPENSFITTGNGGRAYRDWYLEFGKLRPRKPRAVRKQEAETVISPHWVIPPHLNRDPQLTLTLQGVEQSQAPSADSPSPAAAPSPSKPDAPPSIPPDPAVAGTQTQPASQPASRPVSLVKPDVIRIARNPILVKLDMPDPHEKEFMNNQKFEMIVYVDDKRILEVEQGHIPFTYPWDISGLSPGVHILTLNVSSFRNHVGTVSRLVEVQP